MPFLKALPAEAAGRDGTLVVVTGFGPNGMDIQHVGANPPSWQRGVTLYDRLIELGVKPWLDGSVTYNRDTHVPALAERWEFSADGAHVDFSPRTNATFCDGTPVTAEDVKWSFDRAVGLDGFSTIDAPLVPLYRPYPELGMAHGVGDYACHVHRQLDARSRPWAEATVQANRLGIVARRATGAPPSLFGVEGGAMARGFGSHFVYVLRENPVTAVAFSLLLLILFLAAFGPMIAPYDPLAFNSTQALQPPNWAHWFGADHLGRDVFSRVIVATRLDLAISVAAALRSFVVGSGVGKALEDVAFHVGRGEIVGLIGESGSGKSVAAYTAMGILDAAGHVTAGGVACSGMPVTGAAERDVAPLRGREMAMIFQSPRTALNPIRTVGRQIGDVLRRHGGATRQNWRAKAIEALAQVRIPDPVRRAEAYPFELSGGMRQRICIAMALACSPKLLIADEPTTGLDVTTQAAIMALIVELARARDRGAPLITQDPHLAAETCDRIVVMHAGHVVESGSAEAIFARVRHPYTAALIASTPAAGRTLEEIGAIPGGLPDLRGRLTPCRYRARCDRSVRPATRARRRLRRRRAPTARAAGTP